MGLAGVIGLLFSIIFHEFSHSLVARRYGLPIRGITLFLFGGVAEMQEESENPKVEFLMAIAGPIASFLLAAAFHGVTVLAEAQGVPQPVVGVTRYLVFLNLILAIFNMIPAFPLDGGRVLRAALWRWKGDFRWATRIATRVGSTFALVLMGLGILSALGGNFVGGLWWFLIGLFLRAMAASAWHQLASREVLKGVPVRRFMTRDPVTIPADTTVREYVEDYVYRHFHEFFPVTDDGRLVGSVTTREIKAVPRDEWDIKTVGAVATPRSEDNTTDADEDAQKALARMQRSGNARLMVTEGNRLVGVIVLKDILSLLAFKMELDAPAS